MERGGLDLYPLTGKQYLPNENLDFELSPRGSSLELELTPRLSPRSERQESGLSPRRTPRRTESDTCGEAFVRNLEILSLSGEPVLESVSSSLGTVAKLKKEIQRHAGIPFLTQKLCVGDQALDDTTKLSSLKDCSVTLIVLPYSDSEKAKDKLLGAVQRDEIKVVKKCLKHPICPNFHDRHPKCRTPLHEAAYIGNPYLVKLLCEAKADRTARDDEGKTPLHVATQLGHTEAVRYLIRGKSSGVNEVARCGGTPLQLAVMQGHLEVVQVLCGEPGVDKDKASEDSFVHSCSPLQRAARGGHVEIVRTLCDAKANLNKADYKGKQTPLWDASWHGHYLAVRTLLEARADVNASDGDFRTALMGAESQGFEAVARLLREHGAL